MVRLLILLLYFHTSYFALFEMDKLIEPGILDPEKKIQLEQSTSEKEEVRTGLSVLNLLKSRFIGNTISYFDTNLNRFFNGQVIKVYYEESSFIFNIVSGSGIINSVDVYFTIDFRSKLTKKNIFRYQNHNTSGKLANIENEKQLNIMVQSMYSEGGSKGEGPNTSFLKGTDESIKKGPSTTVKYYNTSTKEEKSGKVFVSNNQLFLDESPPSPVKLMFKLR